MHPPLAPQKWVGTTECAALLRSFGVRAQVVDFGVGRAQATSAQPADHAQQPAAAQPVHPGVQCDGCGQCPVVGDRFRSEGRPDYDLCGACHSQPGAAAWGPYRRMMPAAVRMPSQRQQPAGSDDGGGVREQLLRWVWRYFVGDCDVCERKGQLCDCGSAGGQASNSAGGPPSPKRARRSHVRLSGKPPLYFQASLAGVGWSHSGCSPRSDASESSLHLVGVPEPECASVCRHRHAPP
jgi:hypothetical protein